MSAQPEQRSPQWFADRKGRITASRVGAILGLSKYRTPDDVLREMAREMHGAPSEFAGNTATEYGQAHENDALSEYEQLTGVMVETCGLVVHPRHDFLAASPDGLVGRDGLVECKAPFRARYTEPSEEYVAQMQLQLACTNRQWCDFAIYRKSEPLIVQRIQRDDLWLERNLPTLHAFIDRLAHTDPAPHLADKERTDTTWQEAARAYLHAKGEAESYAKLADHHRAQLAELAPEGGKGCGITLSKVETEGRVDYKRALTQMLPDVDLAPFRGKPSISYRVTESKT